MARSVPYGWMALLAEGGPPRSDQEILMGEAQRKRPSPMSSKEAVQNCAASLNVRFIACGSRDTRRVHDPDPDLLVNFAVVDGDLSVCGGRRVVLFVHGYNVTTNEALKSAADFFGKMQAGLVRHPCGYLVPVLAGLLSGRLSPMDRTRHPDPAEFGGLVCESGPGHGGDSGDCQRIAGSSRSPGVRVLEPTRREPAGCRRRR